MDLESDTLLVSGIVSFSDTLSFRIGWGRVGTDVLNKQLREPRIIMGT